VTNQNIQIIQLGPMRVAIISAYGVSPEKEAWRKLIAHADLKKLIKNRNEHSVFGFSNSRPSPANSEFAYVFWVKVGLGFEPEKPLRIIDFSGGPYAVTRCLIQDADYQKRWKEWKALNDWCKNQRIGAGHHQTLEKYIRMDDEFENLILDLYYPIIY
jgi:DNA gyrase inhibitor GyrI